MRSHLLTGAKLVMYVNGSVYALVTDFSWNYDTTTRVISGVDSMDAFELAPTTTRVAGTLELLRQSADGGAEGAGMSAKQQDLSRKRYFSLVLVERGTDVVVFQATKCSVSNQNWRVPSHGIVRGTVSFLAIDYANETDAQ